MENRKSSIEVRLATALRRHLISRRLRGVSFQIRNLEEGFRPGTWFCEVMAPNLPEVRKELDYADIEIEGAKGLSLVEVMRLDTQVVYYLIIAETGAAA